MTAQSAALSGNYTITVLATDNCNQTTTATLPITIICLTVTLSPATLPNATINTAYPRFN